MANNFGRVNVSITASTGGLTAGLSKAGKSLNRFRSAAEAGTGGIGGMFRSAAAGALGLGTASSVGAVGVTMLSTALKSLLLPLGIVAAIAAPFAAFASATAAAEQLHNLSQELGVAVGDLQVLQQVAAETGVSQEAMTTGLRRTARMVGELAQGTPAAVKAFEQLGLTMQDMAGLSTAQQFDLIAQRIAALPPHMQAAAAIDIFGRSGQGLLNFIRQGGDSISEMDTLLTQLGVKMSGPQVAAIEAMGDAIGRLMLPMQGFINQFLAELAPAITAVSNMIVKFFAENTAGWTVAKTLADGFIQGIRLVVGAVTLLTGVFQVFMALGSQIGQMFSELFAVILVGVSRVMKSMASLAEAAGFTDLASTLANGAGGVSQMATGAREMGQVYGDAAASSFASAVENIGSPFAAFDAELEAARNDAAAAGAAPIQQAAAAAGVSIAKAIGASTADLKAVVVGSSDGESFRNAMARGADPRFDVKEDTKRTADNTERTADAVEDIADELAASGVSMATIMV